jgi:hypothetical protein
MTLALPSEREQQHVGGHQPHSSAEESQQRLGSGSLTRLKRHLIAQLFSSPDGPALGRFGIFLFEVVRSSFLIWLVALPQMIDNDQDTMG